MTIFDADGTEVALYYGGSPYVIADEATGSIYPVQDDVEQILHPWH